MHLWYVCFLFCKNTMCPYFFLYHPLGKFMDNIWKIFGPYWKKCWIFKDIKELITIYFSHIILWKYQGVTTINIDMCCYKNICMQGGVWRHFLRTFLQAVNSSTNSILNWVMKPNLMKPRLYYSSQLFFKIPNKTLYSCRPRQTMYKLRFCSQKKCWKYIFQQTGDLNLEIVNLTNS